MLDHLKSHSMHSGNRKDILGGISGTLYFEGQGPFEEVNILFGDYSDRVSIVDLETKRLNLIGCFFGSGYIQGPKIEEVNFYCCLQQKEEPFDLVDMEIGALNVSQSSITFDKDLPELENHSLPPELENPLLEISDPFTFPNRAPTPEEHEKMDLILSTFPNHPLVTYQITQFAFCCYSHIAEEYFGRLIARILELPPEHQDHFRRLFLQKEKEQYKYGMKYSFIRNHPGVSEFLDKVGS